MPPSAETLAYRICPLCEACCGLELTVSGGAVTAVRGDDADPFSQGHLCPKAVALRDLHEDPDRLRQPLLRRGGVLEPCTWDEAFAEIERRLPPILAAGGRDALGLVAGNPVVHKMGLLLYFARLARAVGTRNIYSAATLDQMPKQLSSGLLFGHWLSVPVPDIERTGYLLVLGANPVVSNGSMWTVPGFERKARALRARGGKLVVVDPRRTETAALADRHLPIRPGADAFLLLAMAQVLLAEGRVRLGRLAEHVAGLPGLADAVAPFTPERVAGRCGIGAGQIRDLARELASAERAAVYGRMGTCTQEYGTLASWLVDVLNVLTGNLDEPGGAMFPRAPAFAANTQSRPGQGKGVAVGRRRSRVSGAPEVMGELPLGCLAEEIETPGQGQVRALLTVATNPVLSAPNGARLARALDGLELMVSVDVYVNETTRHAHVVLPGLSPLEEPHYDVAFPQLAWRNAARMSPAVLPRPAGQPAEWEILLRLQAICLGLGAGIDAAAYDAELLAEEVGRAAGPQAPAVLQALGGRPGPERLLDLGLRTGPYGDGFGKVPAGLSLARLAAAPHGIDLGPLQPRIPEVLRTASGKIELLPDMLRADLFRAAADLDRPVPALVVVGRRQLRSNNSWMHNLPVLAKGPFRCTALVHPSDAARLGLRDGARARLAANGRSVEAEVQVSDEVMPGVVSLPHGWGHDLPGARLRVAAERPGANLNALLDEGLRDPLSGNAVLSGVAVELTPA
ncbi:MAG: molybdopterin-dependent oxidoreductase [Deltaproteobacteria bacterium]|nr:molybdopterin-dependent oxidoreductase [Deltaproteobacteria bacterium]